MIFVGVLKKRKEIMHVTNQKFLTLELSGLPARYTQPERNYSTDMTGNLTGNLLESLVRCGFILHSQL